VAAIEIRVPDIGDFKDVPVIDVLVKPGDVVKKEESLVTLESDKATMDVPSPHAGTVREIRVKNGDKVSQGSVIAVIEADAPAKAEPAAAKAPAPAPAKAASPAASDATALAGAIAQQGATSVRQALTSTVASLEAELHSDVLVLGGGPGG
jgi:pyruvate/2-oxoglutarate dehydrogenase complex dihydrolipoamide acyltransferase (E2) component